MKEYIEREALIAELMKGTIVSDDLYGMGIMSGIDFATKKVVDAPAADVVEVRHAKWLSSEQYNGNPECSACFYVTDEKTNYCPQCGAKMDKEE